MKMLIDITQIVDKVTHFMNEFHGNMLTFVTPEDVVRHEFDCAFFGQTYRDFSTSPLHDAFNIVRCPTDVRKHIEDSIERVLMDLIDSKIHVNERLMYHYNVLWSSPYQVYVEKLS